MMYVCYGKSGGLEVYCCWLILVLSVLRCPDENARCGRSVDNNRREVMFGSYWQKAKGMGNIVEMCARDRRAV
jgi:hypothetical protein